MNILLKTSIAITLSFNLAMSQEMTLTLQDKWNLIAIPTNSTISSEYLNAESVWIYNNGWQKNPSTITKGEGIWLKSNGTQSLSFNGESYKQEFLNLQSGWNLIGTGEDITIPENIKTVLTYDGIWHKNPSIIRAGEGFWANITEITTNNFDFSKYIEKSTASTSTVTIASNANIETHEEESDYSFDNSNIINITLNKNSITIDNSSVATINESNITITSAGVYKISGTLSDGEIIVNTTDEKAVTLILNGVDITSTKSTPIYIENSKKTIVNLINDNYLKDSENSSLDGVLFSRDDLTIYGEGSLSVTSNSNDGIRSNDGLIIKSGNITVTSNDDGIRGKDYLVIKDGDITISSSGDGLKTDNEDSDKGYILIEDGNFNITSGGDTIKGESDILIKSGNFNLQSGGGSSENISSDLSAKGLKAGVKIVIDGGEFTINSADDTIHSNDNIVINGGKFNLSSGDDGIHADTAIELNGGEFNIEKSYEGIESAVITINNGYIQINSNDDGLNVAGGHNESMNPMDIKGMDFNMSKPEDNMLNGDFNMSRPENKPFNKDMNMNQPPMDSNNSFVIEMARPKPDNFTAPNANNFTNLGLSGDYHLNINGGYIVINSKGDGLDANGYIEMREGVVIVNGPTENMNGAIDYDGSFEISGGTLIAVGSSGMAQAPSNSSSQNSLLVKFTSWQNAGEIINIQNNFGEELTTFSPTKGYQSLVFSSPNLTTGETYKLYLGGTSSANQIHGLFESGNYNGGSLYSNFTISNSVTTIR